MAFWGTEVKPGQPFTHAPLNRRLHVSLATLGLGNGTGKSIVQCNVGNNKALFLCCLFPDQSECFPINVEFEESDEVVFSVMGSRPVHLTGYYLSTSSLNHRNDDESESFGEDIADTESEKTKNSEESESDDSFIDDDDHEPTQELSAGSESNEEMPYIMKVRRRRLRKMNESEDEENPQQKAPAGGIPAKEVDFDSDIEDTLPISSLSSRKSESKTKKEADKHNHNQILIVEGSTKKETDNHNGNEIEDNATMKDETNALLSSEFERQVGTLPISSLACRKSESETKKEADKRNDNQILTVEESTKKETDNHNGDEIEDNATMKDEANAVISSELQCQVGTHDGAMRNRKRKEHLEGKKCSNLNTVSEDAPVENSETQKKRKKKKKCKDEEGYATKTKSSVVEMETENANNKEIKLSNGIIVEELEMGKPNGKIASIGTKVRVHYTVKLKESGQVVDSSVGKDCLKFRLGGEKVQELWNVAIDGMQVGGKRRLTVPPSMRYTSDETSENIPSNSWMIFEVDLIKVR